MRYNVVEAHSGAMGGSQSQEFMVGTDAGEAVVVSCAQCGYAANLEKATSKLPPVPELSGDGSPEPIHTPGMKTIEEVAKFLGGSPADKIKTLAYMQLEDDTKNAGQKKARAVIVLLRGDHSLNEAKLSIALGGKEFRPMHAEEIEPVFHSPAGYLGPVKLQVATDSSDSLPLLLADNALKGRKNLISGANQEDHHLKNITPGRDFQPTDWVDLRSASPGEGCPRCGSPLQVGKAMEIGHIFKLGYKYAQTLGATVLDKDGKEVMPIMGSYGIGVDRILAAAVEQNNDQDGFWLPASIAPFDVVVTPTNVKDELLSRTAGEIAGKLTTAALAYCWTIAMSALA